MSQPTETEDATGRIGASAVPDAQHRWRCGGCGNVTRFDVIREAKMREYWHLNLAGVPAVEDSETLSERVAAISCRWCGRDDAIEVIERPGADIT